jgi:membrane protease YdiL (CAAX protease family)
MQDEPITRTFFNRLCAREQPSPWTVGLALAFVAAYAVLWVAALSVVSILTGEVNASLPSNRTLALSALLGGLVVGVGLIQWARRRSGQQWTAVLRLREPSQRNAQLLIVLLSLGLAWAIDLAGAVLRLKGGQIVPPVLDSLRQPEIFAWLVAALVALIVQPIAESLIFSGILYPALARIFSDNRIAIIIVSLIYMLVSLVLSAAPGQWYMMLQPLLMALVVNSVRAYYQSTRAAILARLAFGLFFVLAALFSAGFAAASVPGN